MHRGSGWTRLEWQDAQKHEGGGFVLVPIVTNMRRHKLRTGHYQGEPERDGEILEVLGKNGAPPYVVRWDDGRVSTRQSSSDVFVEHFEQRKSGSPDPSVD
jgi:hypothetical protein